MSIDIEFIKKRTRIVGECWEWTSTLLRGQHPICKVKNKTVYPKRAAWEWKHQKAVPPKMCVVNIKTCGNDLCCNPDHLKIISKGDLLRRTISEGKLHTQLIREKIAEAKRANSKLTQEAAREFVLSDEPVPVLAKKHGISEAYGYMLRKGLFRRETANPFRGLGAR